ncbi:MAG TPA: hypothetical protein VFQ45_08950 [Longimicrobium sp.]|nr:hypothetical protein [Longimicrobium sp.]
MMTTMRLRAAAVAALVLAAGCGLGRPRPAMLPAEVRIPVGATRTVDGGELAISFARVSEDSRCPRGVQCVTAGNAVVALLLQERGAASQAVDLNTGQEPRSARYEGYLVELVALEPVPEQGRTPTDYVAVLRVSEM